MPALRCHILDTGYCHAIERIVMRGGAWRSIHCHSIAALLHHPDHGWTLFDTGYAPRLLAATRRMPYFLYRLVTPLHIEESLTVEAQLERFKLSPGDIRRVIVSHFHADHIAGLRDFPAARPVALGAAYAAVKDLSGLNALRRAFVPALLPRSFERQARLLPAFDGPALPGLGPTHDFFGDGSLLLVELPGHARGQIGMLARTDRGRILFAADGCWLTRQVRERRLPSMVTNILADDPRSVRSTIYNLHAFARACPDVTLIPSHCPEAFAREVGSTP